MTHESVMKGRGGKREEKEEWQRTWADCHLRSHVLLKHHEVHFCVGVFFVWLVFLNSVLTLEAAVP